MMRKSFHAQGFAAENRLRLAARSYEHCRNNNRPARTERGFQLL
jgi:hypothetical protein